MTETQHNNRPTDKFVPKVDETLIDIVVQAGLAGLSSDRARTVVDFAKALTARGNLLPTEFVITKSLTAAAEWIAIQNLLDSFQLRIELANLLVSPLPQELTISQAMSTIDGLTVAGDIFNQDPHPHFEKLTQTEIVFWNSRLPNLEDITRAQWVVAQIDGDKEYLPESLVTAISDGYQLCKAATLDNLQPIGQGEIRAYNIDKNMPAVVETIQIIKLLSNQEQVDEAIDHIAASLKNGQAAITMRSNPESDSYRTGIKQLYEVIKLGSPEKAAGWLEAAGFTRQDLEALVTFSMFAPQGSSIIELTKLAGWYDEKKYKRIVYRALRLTNKTTDPQTKTPVIRWNGEQHGVFAEIGCTPPYVDHLVNILNSAGVPLNDKRVKAAVIREWQRIKGVNDKKSRTVGSQFMQSLIEAGILTEGDQKQLSI